MFLDAEFSHQTAFILDSSRWKAALCTRRSGKSYGAACYLLKEAWEHPGVTCLYIALTRESARSILWGILKTINRRLKLGLTKDEFNETLLEVRLPNNSIIKLSGANASEDEKEKFLGQKYRLVVIDEAASFTTDLEALVHKTLEPAVRDERGTICLIGTPSNIKSGLFFRVTTGAFKETDVRWAVHKWSEYDNPYMREQRIEEEEKITATRPRFRETATYRQMYLGEWAVSEDTLVYKYEATRNSYSSLPKAAYRTVLGVDLGFDDDTAFVLCSYQSHDPTLYVLETFSAPGMTITKVAETIKHYESRYSIDSIVIDGANKQAVEEMRQHHGLSSLEAADKKHKFEFIDLLNDDLQQGRIKLSPDCAALVIELQELVIDEKALLRSNKRVEHPGCSNHLCDALLYAWRHTYQYLASLKHTEPEIGSREWEYAEEQRWIDAQRGRLSNDLFTSDPFPV